MELCPPLHHGVVAIEKSAFGSPSTKVANFTYLCTLCQKQLNFVGILAFGATLDIK